MSVAVIARSAVLTAYLVALAWHGRADPLAWLTALAVAGLWIASVLRDRRRRQNSAPAREFAV
jgi:hypothetical protein